MSDGRSRSGDERSHATQSQRWAPGAQRARALQHRPIVPQGTGYDMVDSSFDSPDTLTHEVPVLQLQTVSNSDQTALVSHTPQQLFPASSSNAAISPITQGLSQPMFGFQATAVSAVQLHQAGAVQENLLHHAAERINAAETHSAQTAWVAEQAVQEARTTAVWAVAQSQIDANARVSAAEQ